jgi:elongation factor Ts
VPADVVAARQAELAADEALAKKPEGVRAQIVEGQMRKWYEEVCLLEQPFRDSGETVEQLITNAIATIGENIRVRRFVRYALGEEI